MHRRTFLGTVAGGLLAAPLAVEAQKAGKVWQIGYLTSFPLTWGKPATFVRALRARGWVEGPDYVLEARWADRKSERLTEFAMSWSD